MIQQDIIALLSCAIVLLSVVHSAPSQLERGIEISCPHHEYLPPSINLSDATVMRNSPTVMLSQNLSNEVNDDQLQRSRSKRAIIFRPLFVYRQQEIKKQKLKEMREQQQQANRQQSQAPSPSVCAACSQQHTNRGPVRYYAQQYPYQH